MYARGAIVLSDLRTETFVSAVTGKEAEKKIEKKGKIGIGASAEKLRKRKDNIGSDS